MESAPPPAGKGTTKRNGLPAADSAADAIAASVSKSMPEESMHAPVRNAQNIDFGFLMAISRLSQPRSAQTEIAIANSDMAYL